MAEDNKIFTIFYSWQSDLPEKSNRQFLRQQLRQAINSVESKRPEIRFVLDEATRDLPGSPNIPLSILRKIREADLFVGDITTINSASESKKTPNPNVVFELGYAVSTLGWGRVVLLFNTNLGNLSNELPFDFDRHRVSKFKASNPPTKEEINNAKDLLEDAILAIIKHVPAKGNDCLSEDEIKRKRDIDSIAWVLSKFHIPTFDFHTKNLPYEIYDDIFFFWEGVNGVLGSNLFYLYNTELYQAFVDFYLSFKDTVSYGEFYYSKGKDSFAFGHTQGEKTKREQRIFEIVKSSSQTMDKNLKKILAIIRRDYIEIDLDEINRLAWNSFLKHKENAGA